jgi:hypothetical protein
LNRCPPGEASLYQLNYAPVLSNSYAYIGSVTRSVTHRLYITEQTANILKRRTEVFDAPLLADTQRKLVIYAAGHVA